MIVDRLSEAERLLESAVRALPRKTAIFGRDLREDIEDYLERAAADDREEHERLVLENLHFQHTREGLSDKTLPRYLELVRKYGEVAV